jgi:hypothetical protein
MMVEIMDTRMGESGVRDSKAGITLGIAVNESADVNTKSQILNVTTPLTDFRGIWGLLEYYTRNDVSDKVFVKEYFSTLNALVDELDGYVTNGLTMFGSKYPRQRILYKSIRIISFIFVLLREYGYTYDEAVNVLGLIKLFEENNRT